MMEVSVNYVAVLLAAVASMVVGFLWYGPLFGKAWIKLKGFTEESLKAEQKKMGLYYGLTFLLALLMAFVLSHVMAMSAHFYQVSLLQAGLTSAFWMWLGFVMPVQASGAIFSHKNGKLLSIDTGYQLASLMVMGLILGYLS